MTPERATAPEVPENGGDVGRPLIAGWSAFLCWAAVGGTVALSIFAIASIGLWLLPLALVLAWLTSRYVASGPELLGLFAGAGVVPLVIGLASLGTSTAACPEQGAQRLQGAADNCGGLNPVSWLVIGALLTLLSIVAFGSLRRNDQR